MTRLTPVILPIIALTWTAAYADEVTDEVAYNLKWFEMCSEQED